MENLLFGFASSMFQSSKFEDCGQSNWTDAMNNNTVKKSKVSISHWENWRSDILKMKNEFCVNTYRVSLEWSHIEPEHGKLDHEILMKYKEIAVYCKSIGIKAMFTLHHFTEPLWFSKLGGFEKEENIEYFIEFCLYVYSNLHTVVKLWCTFNEPAIYAFMGYLLGGFPPHCHNLAKTIIVLKNLLMAHVKVYVKLKEFDTTCQIGIVHNVLIFKQLYQYDLVSYGLISFFNVITNDLVINFFKTGKFKYYSLFVVDVDYNEPDAKFANDFIGLNFYANPVVGPNSVNYYGATYFDGQEMGDMYLPLDPVGFSNAINLVASLNLPIYITEIGIADKTDLLRQKFVGQYLNVIREKLIGGTKIMACYFWTYRDNYEWDQNDKLFGFYDENGNPKESCKVLRNQIMLDLMEYEVEYQSTNCIVSNFNTSFAANILDKPIENTI